MNYFNLNQGYIITSDQSDKIRVDDKTIEGITVLGGIWI